MRLRQLADAVLAALLAPPCASCARVLDNPLDGAVCEACWRAVAATAQPHSRHGSRSLSRIDAIGLYEGRLRDVIHALKYDGRRSIAPRLSQLMADHARETLNHADFAVPVPLHQQRQRERGFNQAADLADGLGLPIYRVLRRTKRTRPQVELSAQERHLNVVNAFSLVGRPSTAMRHRLRRHRRGPIRRGELAGTVIILVDDVTTTGATLEACAQVLLGAGAQEVRGLTAARVVT